MVIRSLYDSANTLCRNFGFTIPTAAMVLGIALAALILWGFIAALRNRKSFTLEDEDDGKLRESSDRVHGGVLRQESGA